MKILGISGYYHDSAAAIVCDDEIIAAAEEERFSRRKHDAGFPAQSIKFCLDFAGLTLNDLDAIVFYDKPFLKFERLLETYFDDVPKGLGSFVTAMPVWLKEKVFLKKTLNDELKKIDPAFAPKSEILFTEHHLAHAASAYYTSSFPEAAILTIDGVGEWATASICSGKGNKITVLKELRFPDSVGLLYSSFTYFLGFKVNSGEYKVMGLAPYGNHSDAQTIQFINLIENELVTIFENGSIRLNKKYFSYQTGLRMIDEDKWEKLFHVPAVNSNQKISQAHCNLALAIQKVTERIVLLMAKHAKELTGSDYLALAGGVALNSVANGKLQKTQLFKDIFIQPAAGDSGGAIGAALAANHIYFNRPRRQIPSRSDGMHNCFLGPEYSDLEIQQVARKYGGTYQKIEDEFQRSEVIAQYLLQGKVIGFFSGRMEFGPRALGNRSIMASPLETDMQNKINLKIKFRESFRPFAAIVQEEESQHYFDFAGLSPYMMLVHPVSKDYLLPLPDKYNELSMNKKLETKKSAFPAVTHVDGSCRIQTVSKSTQPGLWVLLNCFKKVSGFPILINTSFNVRGEPIVCTPDEAYRCFMHTGMDILVMNNFLFVKQEQTGMKEGGIIEQYLAQDNQ